MFKRHKRLVGQPAQPCSAKLSPSHPQQRVEAEARRLTGLGATMLRALEEEGLDHYGVAMTGPEGNELDIN